jgi:hypothetical protein
MLHGGGGVKITVPLKWGKAHHGVWVGDATSLGVHPTGPTCRHAMRSAISIPTSPRTVHRSRADESEVGLDLRVLDGDIAELRAAVFSVTWADREPG